ncbi:hypothetical protein KIN20_020641 [Parelaphostrongylus tenuis]|uniref:Uncharacterized protein n=1 Tax=Parelaphostrongylus tenuis TaxID=148309 RepID=A0AAD5N3E8_PARTN|nr:hypothetical protein KIN20_020641 [Parelaphostrongylus tenuis]
MPPKFTMVEQRTCTQRKLKKSFHEVFMMSLPRMGFGDRSPTGLPTSCFGDGVGPKSQAEVGKKIKRLPRTK